MFPRVYKLAWPSFFVNLQQFKSKIEIKYTLAKCVPNHKASYTILVQHFSSSFNIPSFDILVYRIYGNIPLKLSPLFCLHWLYDVSACLCACFRVCVFVCARVPWCVASTTYFSACILIHFDGHGIFARVAHCLNYFDGKNFPFSVEFEDFSGNLEVELPSSSWDKKIQ